MKKRISNIKNKINYALFTLGTLMFKLKASCDIDAGTINSTMDSIDSTKSAAEKFVGLFVMFISWTGSVVLVIGLYKFVIAIKDDRPEEKARGIEMMAVGIVLIVIKSLLQHIGLLTGKGFAETLHNEPGKS